ncbi:hypothetical protein ACIQ7Q_23145 [Streptomyces sp. NPDC096176]
MTDAVVAVLELGAAIRSPARRGRMLTSAWAAAVSLTVHIAGRECRGRRH